MSFQIIQLHLTLLPCQYDLPSTSDRRNDAVTEAGVIATFPSRGDPGWEEGAHPQSHSRTRRGPELRVPDRCRTLPDPSPLPGCSPVGA